MSRNHKTLTKHGYLLSKNKLTNKQKKKIIQDLNVTPITHPDFGDDAESFPIYKEDESTYCIPRYYGIQHFGEPKKKIGFDDKQNRLRFKGNLRPKQVPIYEECIEKIKSNGGGIISLPCGWGDKIY
jgi:hypothetical protein